MWMLLLHSECSRQMQGAFIEMAEIEEELILGSKGEDV